MKILITSGPTREAIDPVRFLSSRSSGKMGRALVEVALLEGHEVILISGPVSLSYAKEARLINVQTSQEMCVAVLQELGQADILIMAAAVSDYRVCEQSLHKIKKTNEKITLDLIKNSDILEAVAKQSHSCFVVGFAAESENLLENAEDKMKHKSLDMIIANDISCLDTGFDSEENRGIILYSDGRRQEVSKCAKLNFAKSILQGIFQEIEEKEMQHRCI